LNWPLIFPGRLRSVRCALRGLGILLATQPNAWLHTAVTLAVIGAGLLWQLTRGEWCALLLASSAVWVAEGLNTALELLADATHPAFHPLIGRAKDVAAGAVLLAALGAAVTGVLIFGPCLIQGLAAFCG
jgi:diacylglycerol kinase (ATP)